MVYSNNRYDVTLGKFVDGLEEGDFGELDEAELSKLEKKSLKKISKQLKIC